MPGTGSGEAGNPVPALDPFEDAESYLTFFSSRAIPSLIGGVPRELDILPPGTFMVVPFGAGPRAGFFFLNGTSFSSPLTARVAALMLEKNPSLGQAGVESIMKSTALPMTQP